MSEIDQAFIKAYQETGAMPRAERRAAPALPATTSPMQHTWRLDAEHTAAPAAPSRVPTPHLHLAARSAPWLERPQPQLVAAGESESAAEMYYEERAELPAASDPWSIPAPAPAASSAPRPSGPGFGGPSPATPNAAASKPENFAAYSSAIKPNAVPPASMSPSLPVRPMSSAPWNAPTQRAEPQPSPAPAERIGFVEQHTAEITQHLSSIAHTLARLEGDEPTEICVESKEVTLVIHQGERESESHDAASPEPIEAKLAALSPAPPKPELKIVLPPVEPVAEAAAPAPEKIAAKVAAAPPAAAAAPLASVAPAPETAAPATFAIAAPDKFQPQWEVDKFQWPDVLDRLQERAASEISQACDAIQAACAAGEQVLAITGVEESTGSTTLLLVLGRELARRGTRVAIVDADFDRPTLAERTGLRIQHGWEATLTGSLPLEEVTIASIADNLTLVPLVARQGVSSTMASLHAAKHLRRLREHFDAVLIDGGVGSENVAALVTATADDALEIAVVLTVDQRRTEPAATSEVVSRLRHCGINSIQLGETFVTA